MHLQYCSAGASKPSGTRYHVGVGVARRASKPSGTRYHVGVGVASKPSGTRGCRSAGSRVRSPAISSEDAYNDSTNNLWEGWGLRPDVICRRRRIRLVRLCVVVACTLIRCQR